MYKIKYQNKCIINKLSVTYFDTIESFFDSLRRESSASPLGEKENGFKIVFITFFMKAVKSLNHLMVKI